MMKRASPVIQSAALVVAAIAGSSLAGCSLDILRSELNFGTVSTEALTTVVLKPVTGPPERVSTELAHQLNRAAAPRNIAFLIDPDAKAPQSLIGYVVMVRDSGGLMVVYNWDLRSENGELSRVAGEERVEATETVRDPWDDVSAAATLMIAEKAIALIDSHSQKQ